MVGKRLLALIWLLTALLAPGMAWADAATPSGSGGTGTQPSGAATPGPQAICGSLKQQAGATSSSDFAVQLDPDTLWRPEGTEVRFTVAALNGSAPAIAKVIVCFRWEAKDAAGQAQGWLPSPLVHSVLSQEGVVTQGGAAAFGAEVPLSLDGRRLSGNPADPAQQQAYTALHTVPLADMEVFVQGPNGLSAVTLPVGVTRVGNAWIVVLVSLAIACLILWRLAPSSLLTRDAGWIHRISQHVLAIISNPEGIASLSQFQVLLWTFVVAAAAIYVMVLSGNLISISDGTLELLGIAGGTHILASINQDKPGTGAPVTVIPRWSQMLVDKFTGEIDVTRVQMLIFTLITAAFVLVQVITSYSIPEIPANFIVLMGISNGVYLAGRQTAAPPAGGSSSGKPVAPSTAPTGAGPVPGA